MVKARYLHQKHQLVPNLQIRQPSLVLVQSTQFPVHEQFLLWKDPFSEKNLETTDTSFIRKLRKFTVNE